MNMYDLFINENITINEAIKKLDDTAKKILVVVENNKLKGIVTDGDVRRWILRSGSLQEHVGAIMNKVPKYIYEKNRDDAKKILKEQMIEAIPVVNSNNEVIDIIFWNDKFKYRLNHFNKLENSVVIMAGGKGTRLDPYTKIIPKPLIPIGDIPIIERIINRFTEYGCDKFYMTVNYKKNMIKAYFNEIEKTYNVEYVEEDKPLGTAGSLSLLKGVIKDTFFVSNCDILVDANYSDILKYHSDNGNKVTLVTSLKHYTIPYGVIEINANSCVERMTEKPEYDYLVNTGMYILEPEALNDIPEDTLYHITDLINQYIKNGEKIGIYPVSDKEWLDMGELKEMENMYKALSLE